MPYYSLVACTLAFGADCFEHDGGLARLWCCEVSIRIQRFDKLHIDAFILDLESEVELRRFTGLYGES